MSIENVHDLVVRGKAKLVPAAVQETLDEGVDASAILDTMISAMDVVGENFKNGTIFVPEMLIAAKAMKKGVEVLKPHLASGAAGALGKVIIGTVAGDILPTLAHLLSQSRYACQLLTITCYLASLQQ